MHYIDRENYSLQMSTIANNLLYNQYYSYSIIATFSDYYNPLTFTATPSISAPTCLSLIHAFITFAIISPFPFA